MTKDVDPYTIVAGVPARPIRERFTPVQGAALFEIAWWDWSHEAFGQALADFRSLSIDAFIEVYKPA